MACDSGGIFSWTVRSIELILGEELKGTNSLQPWFKYDIGDSAWGLAIHKAARVIAVSCNLRTITVFIPALIKDPIIGSEGKESKCRNIAQSQRFSSEFGNLNEAWHTSLPQKNPDWLNKMRHRPTMRSRNVMIILKGHMENIPSISFFNTDREEEKVYLASTDIEGWTYIWEVWSRKLLAKIPGHLTTTNGE